MSSSSVIKITDMDMCSWQSVCRLQYEIGKVTLPEFGYLYAFESRDAARLSGYSGRMFECMAEIVDIKPIRCGLIGESAVSLREWWQYYNNWKFQEDCPSGTVMCAWIAPIREIV